jgi:hypothetical protein
MLNNLCQYQFKAISHLKIHMTKSRACVDVLINQGNKKLSVQEFVTELNGDTSDDAYNQPLDYLEPWDTSDDDDEGSDIEDVGSDNNDTDDNFTMMTSNGDDAQDKADHLSVFWLCEM